MTTTYNYEERYSGNYQAEKNRALLLTNGQCVVCGNPADEVHHSYYTHGYDEALVNLFPLCSHHHGKSDFQCAHHKDNWIVEDDPALSRNTDNYIKFLNEKAERFKPKDLSYQFDQLPQLAAKTIKLLAVNENLPMILLVFAVVVVFLIAISG